MVLTEAEKQTLKNRGKYLNTLEAILEGREKGSYTNIDYRRNIGVIGTDLTRDANGNPMIQPNHYIGMPADQVDEAVKAYAESCSEFINTAIKGNLEAILAELPEKALISMITSAVAPKPKEIVDKYKKAAEYHKQIQTLTEASQQGNLGPYVKLVKDKYAQRVLESQAAVDPQKILHSMQGYIQYLNQLFLNELAEGEGKERKISSEKMKEYIIANYALAKDKEKKATHLVAGKFYGMSE